MTVAGDYNFILHFKVATMDGHYYYRPGGTYRMIHKSPFRDYAVELACYMPL